MKKLLFLILAAPLGCIHAQVNLNTTIPAPQVQGILQGANGGFGISTTGQSGCPRLTSNVWTISVANCGGTAPTFAINSFTGCNGSVELGAAVVNPTCSATYSVTPSSASLTNTDGVSSPTVLTTPFTSGTISGTFTHSAVATTTITLTAVGSTTQTATQQYLWLVRYFGGVGSAGATSTVTASGTTAVLSTSNVLASTGLYSSVVANQTYGPFTASSQKVYILIQGGTHTFKDPGTGFPFAFNTPTAVSFTNVNGIVVTMYLYESTNALIGTYSVQVVT